MKKNINFNKHQKIVFINRVVKQQIFFLKELKNNKEESEVFNAVVENVLSCIKFLKAKKKDLLFSTKKNKANLLLKKKKNRLVCNNYTVLISRI